MTTKVSLSSATMPRGSWRPEAKVGPCFVLGVVDAEFAFVEDGGHFSIGEDVEAAELGVFADSDGNGFDVEGRVVGGGG